MRKLCWLLILGVVGGAAGIVRPRPVLASTEDDLYSVASRAYRDELYGVCANQLSLFLQQYPHSQNALEAHFMLGRSYLELGQYSEALVELKQALGPEGSPQVVEILYWLGEAFLKNKDYDSARGYFQQLTEHFPTSSYTPFAQYSIAWSYWDSGRWQEAFDAFQQVIQKYPDDPLRIESQFRAGECLVRLNQNTSAIKLLNNFVVQFPVTKYIPQTYYLLGEALALEQKPLEAIEAYRKAIGVAQHGPWAPLAQNAIGMTYFSIQKYPESVEAFKNYLEYYPRGPEHDRVRFHLGRALMLLGQPQEAIDYFSQLAQQVPDSPWADDALYWRGELWYNQGLLAEAAGSFMQLLERYPSSDLIGETYYALGWAQLKLNNKDTALETFQLAAAKSRDAKQRASAFAQAGDLFLQQKSYEQALDCYDQILSESPEGPYADYAQYKIGQVLTLLGRTEAAKLAYEALLTRYPHSRLAVHALYQAGLLDFQKGNYLDAQTHFQALLKSSDVPDSLVREVRYQLGNVLLQLGQAEAAAKIFREIVRSTPDQENLDRLALYQLGWALYRQGKIPEALKTFEGYLDVYPNSEIAAELTVWLAQYHYNRGESAQALQLLTRMLSHFQQSPTLPEIEFWQGKILLSLGQRKEALQILESLIQSHADHPQSIEAVRTVVDAYQHEANPIDIVNFLTQTAEQTTSTGLQRACWESLGNLFKMQGQHDQAIVYFRRVLDNEGPDKSTSAQYQIASCYEESGRYEQAVMEYLKAAYLTQDPAWQSKAQWRGAELSERLGRLQDAIRLYETLATSKTQESKLAQERLQQLKHRLETSS